MTALAALLVSENENFISQSRTRSSATAEKLRVSCAYLGWPADLLMITHSRLVVQCTVSLYVKIAEVVLFFDIQTL